MLLLALILDEDDTDLMHRVAHGDEAAFRHLYEKYLDAVYSMALKITRDPHMAEDIAQDVFLRLWQRAGQYRSQRGRVLTWLLSITRNHAIDRIRYDNRRPVAEEELDLTRLETANRTIWQAFEDDVLRLSLDELPPEQRQCLELAFFYGLSHSDIAEMLNVPLGTVKSRIRLGLQKLRAIYLEEGQEQSKSPASDV
nr:sigma-70 family RNA polymerase sigma factor [Ardenticatena sp.]